MKSFPSPQIFNIILFVLHFVSSIKPRTLSTFIPLHEPQILSRADNSWTDGGNETIWTVQFRGQGSPKVILDLRLGFIMGSGRKPGDEEYSRPGLTIAGGLSTALADLYKQRDFFGKSTIVNFDLRVAETYGDEERSIRAVASFWKDWNVSLIIGPQETCVHEGRLSASLNIPIISYFCSDELTSDKRHFPTFSRTRPPDAAISKAVASLVLTYGWNESVTLIYSDSPDDQRAKRVARGLSVLLSAHTQIPYKGPYHHGYGDNPFDAIVARTKDTTRIYIITAEYFEHLGLLLALKKHNLLDKGEYLVIGVSMDDYKDDVWNPRRYFRGLLTDEDETDEAPSAFQSYLGILASPPRNFNEFSRRVNYWMEQQPFEFKNPLSKLGGMKNIRIEAAYLYDAVMLYAHAIKEIVLEEQTSFRELVDGIGGGGTSPILSSPSSSRPKYPKSSSVTSDWSLLGLSDLIKSRILDGRSISQRLRNIRYQSATGHETKMDENGDAEGNFTLISLKNRNGILGLYPVGLFSRSSSQLPELTLFDKIAWVGGKPPLSQPPCGFFGEKCQRDTSSLWTLATLALILTFVMGGVYLVFRHWRLSRDMDTLLWRIDKKDISWESGQMCPLVGGRIGTGSQASLARFSTLYAPLVQYRERHFAAKAISIGQLDTQMKHQLKLLREIRHENLNPFIGACLYEESLVLISEYCSRGSLKDILDNGDLKLDDMFISSLVGDLLRGLSYIHDSSPFRAHGNLKPTNCLIDSRWNLKLTDFGLKRYEFAFGSKAKTELAAAGHTHSTTSGGGGGVIGQNHSSTTRASYTFTSSFTSHHSHSHNHNHHHHSNSLGNPGGGCQINSCPFFITSPYLPPEYPLHPKQRHSKSGVEGYRKGDIYSLGAILWELLRRQSLANYLGLKEELEIREIVCNGYALTGQSPARQIVLGNEKSSLNEREFSDEDGPRDPFWPRALALITEDSSTLSSEGNKTGWACQLGQIKECIADCLKFEPDARPDVKSVRNRLRPLHKGMRSNIFDIMIGLMEKYANNLEILVDDRTKQLSEEKRKTESLLYELIPASVAEELKEGLRVPAKNYDSVSIYFSDIVGFTSMSAQSTPLQVVEFLNELYTCFDSVIDSFDVYKIETIGDAYMVASGVPVIREGNYHAVEMARMALQLLLAVTNFKIRHRPHDETVKLRIGIHSGPICAGVVGLKRPRYCLFGDTVNTASRMESTGLPLKIHCSQAFASLVEESERPRFLLEKRGWVDVKGKGDMLTFWLLGQVYPTPQSNPGYNQLDSD